jgi:hypothetical protein
MSKKAAITEIVKMRDQLVIMRERLFQLSAATAARTKEVEGLLIDCAAAGRVFGAPIGLPDWNNVLATPGPQSALSLDDELKEEMERVTNNIYWNSPESGLDRTNNDLILLHDLVATLDEWVQSRPAPKRTLRHIVESTSSCRFAISADRDFRFFLYSQPTLRLRSAPCTVKRATTSTPQSTKPGSCSPR